MEYALSRWCLACVLTCVWSGATHAQQDLIRLEPLAATTPDRLGDLGVIKDAASDVEGRVFMLAAGARRIVVTDARLQPLMFFEPRGSADGALSEPVSIAVLAGGRLAVLDRALRHISILRIRDGGRSLVPERTVPVAMHAESMCAPGGSKVLVYGLSAGNRLHLLDLDTRAVRSFAPADPTFSPMAQDLLTQGRIACDSIRDEVVISSRYLPEVEAFRISTGERVWSATLLPFRAVTITDRGTSVTVAERGRGGYSQIVSLLSADDHRVFQTVYHARFDHARADTVLTYVYSTSRQTWMPHESNPPLLFPLGRSRVLSVEQRSGGTIRINRLGIGTPGAEPLRTSQP